MAQGEGPQLTPLSRAHFHVGMWARRVESMHSITWKDIFTGLGGIGKPGDASNQR